MKEKSQKKNTEKYIVKLFLITIFLLLIYSNSFSSSWHLDDYSSILDNYKIKNISTCLKEISTNPRGICDLSFALNYYFSGVNVFWYHVVNVVIHLISSVLVYCLITLTVNLQYDCHCEEAERPKQSNILPLLGSLLFALHPLQTQAVTYVVQRYTSLATMFYLAALLFFIRARMSQLQGKGRFFSFRHLSFYLCSFLSALLAMRTKEIAATIPFIFLLYDFTFLKGRGRDLKKAFLYILPFFILLGVQVISRTFFAGSCIAAFGEAIDRSLKDTVRIGRVEYALTSANVVLTYIRLLLFPVNQNISYVYPVSTSIFSNSTYLSLLVHIFILAFGVAIFRISRIVPFGIFWFYITVSVESSLIPIRDVIFEHRVYLPSVGFAIFFAGLVLLADKKRELFYGFTAIALLMLSILTYNRNSVWKDDVMLWSSSLRVNKNNPTAYLLLGNFYLGEKLYDKSIDEYKRALSINPGFAEVHSNLAYAYEQKGLLDIAVNEYREAYILRPDYAEAHINLGNLFKKKGLLDSAISEYKKALRIKPGYAEACINMGNAYKEKGRYDLAEIQYKRALNIKPDFPRGYYALGNLYAERGFWNKSIDCYKKAIDLDKNLYEAYNKLGSLYYDMKRFDDAISVFDIVIKIKPNNIVAYNNLATVYAQEGRFDDAIKNLKKALEINPELVDTRFNLGLAYYSIGEKERAIDEFRRILEINPDYKRAKEKLDLIEKESVE